MTFGNLATLSGFKIISCNTFQHKWPPGFQSDFNKPGFHDKCRRYAKQKNNYQIKLVAKK